MAQDIGMEFLNQNPQPPPQPQVMCMTQEISMEFMGTNYLLKVIGLARLSEAGDTVRALGMLGTQTLIP